MGLSVWWSGVGALLFGIHPMRVESVAWITERKDVLYGFFYLSALLAYIRYIASGKAGYFLLTFCLFFLSLLSKGQAVALPFSLVLLDWYFGRKMNGNAVMEKLIFFAMALLVGLLGTTFFFQNVYKTIDSKAIVNAFNFFEQTVLAGYAYTIYILKFFIPYVTSTLYPAPEVLHAGHWIGAISAVMIFLWAVFVWRQYKFITFGLLFFTFNILFLLMPFLAAIRLSERSVYLHGLCRTCLYRGLQYAEISGAKTFLAPSSGRHCGRDPGYLQRPDNQINSGLAKQRNTLTYVIEKYPSKISAAYLNRGNDRCVQNRHNDAIHDYTTAIDLNPQSLWHIRTEALPM
jgi:hypothetical protein